MINATLQIGHFEQISEKMKAATRKMRPINYFE
jgi:hypothetical protein